MPQEDQIYLFLFKLVPDIVGHVCEGELTGYGRRIVSSRTNSKTITKLPG